MVWTTETDAPASILCERIRVCALGATGAPLVGSTSMYVTDAVTKITWQQAIEGGVELIQRNGSGNLCVLRRTPDLVKWGEVTVEICAPDPELEWLLTGGTVLKTGTDTHTVGYQEPELGLDPVPYGVSIEAWSDTEENGQEAGTNQLFHWAWPKVKLEKKGARSLELGVLANAFEGYGYQNANWGSGPNDGWSFDSTRWNQRVRVDLSDMPASTIGLQAVAA